MSLPRYSNTQSAEAEIRQLKSDLYVARRAIIGLMPYEVDQLLHGYYSCESREATRVWMNDVVETLIERVDKPTLLEDRLGERRARCPLCNEGSSSLYVEGYSLPEGLRRHLVGWGNARQCVVVDAAFRLARDHWNEKFAAAEQEAWDAERATKAQRRKTETLYRTSPDNEPRLLDEGSHSWAPSRTREQLKWAEDRLRSLGFQCVTDGNILSWTDEREDCVVYADPRLAGRIDFEVWRTPLPKRPRTSSRLRRLPGRFHLLDSWKKDLPAKYAQRVASGMTE
ncbi:hypothetical protein [Cupriavidus sp. 8B]